MNDTVGALRAWNRADRPVLDSLQITAKHRLATPADWRQGQDLVITPAVSDEEAAELFPGFTTHKPYLRTTAAPQG